jgi:hypothetical protein
MEIKKALIVATIICSANTASATFNPKAVIASAVTTISSKVKEGANLYWNHKKVSIPATIALISAGSYAAYKLELVKTLKNLCAKKTQQNKTIEKK